MWLLKISHLSKRVSKTLSTHFAVRMPTYVPGFDDFRPKYVCCHIRSCAFGIALLEMILGLASGAVFVYHPAMREVPYGFLAGNTFQSVIENKFDEFSGFLAVGGFGLALGSCVLIIGLLKESKGLIALFMFICCVYLLLLLCHTMAIGIYAIFNPGQCIVLCHMAIKDCKVYDMLLIICLSVTLILTEFYFLNKMCEVYNYMRDKDSARLRSNNQLKKFLLEHKTPRANFI